MGFPWGLDLGNQNCVIAIARKGGIDVIDNEASSRKVRLFDLACTRVHAREWGLPPPDSYPEHDARVRTGALVLAVAESSAWAQGGRIWPSFGVRCRGLLHVTCFGGSSAFCAARMECAHRKSVGCVPVPGPVQLADSCMRCLAAVSKCMGLQRRRHALLSCATAR